MPDDVLLVEYIDAVARLTLNRPSRRNALDEALRDAVTATLEAIEANDDIRVAVITGAGETFCAGFDRSEFATKAPTEVFAGRSSKQYHHRLQHFAKPLIAAVNGPALGGGTDIAALSDIRIAAESAVFGQPQIKFGAGVMVGPLAAIVGLGPAARLCLTGETVDARTALSIGLVSEVVPGPELLDRALALARTVAEAPLGTLVGVKASIRSASIAVGGDR